MGVWGEAILDAILFVQFIQCLRIHFIRDCTRRIFVGPARHFVRVALFKGFVERIPKLGIFQLEELLSFLAAPFGEGADCIDELSLARVNHVRIVVQNLHNVFEVGVGLQTCQDRLPMLNGDIAPVAIRGNTSQRAGTRLQVGEVLAVFFLEVRNDGQGGVNFILDVEIDVAAAILFEGIVAALDAKSVTTFFHGRNEVVAVCETEKVNHCILAVIILRTVERFGVGVLHGCILPRI